MFEIRDLQVIQGGKTLWDGLSFRLNAGERLGISAPSGFGKTTLGRVLAQWQQPHARELLLDGKPLPKAGYCPVQLVPQHPEKCFNPYRTTGAGYMMPGNRMRNGWKSSALSLTGWNVVRMSCPAGNWRESHCCGR